MQLPSYDKLFPNAVQPSAPERTAAISPSPSPSIGTVVFTRGSQFIRPSAFQTTRSNFETNLYNALGGQAMINDAQLARVYGISGTTYACTEKRAKFVASVPLYVGDPEGNTLLDTPLDWFLSIQSAPLLHSLLIGSDVWGRNYLRKQYNGHGYPTGLEWLNPACIREQLNRATGNVDYYDYYDPITFRVERLSVEEVIYIPTFDSRPGGAGLSKFEVAWRELNIQAGMAIYAAAFFVNSAAIDGVISFDGDVGEDQLTLAQKQWADSFKGARNAHRAVMLPAGGKWTPIQAVPKDLAMGELDDRTTKRIHAIFDIDAALTGMEAVSDPLSANSTYSAKEVSHIRNVTLPFLKLVVLPELNRQWAQRDFDLKEYFTLYYDETRIPALAEANLAKMTSARDGRGSNLLTSDEAREMIGFSKQAEGTYFIRSPQEAQAAWQAGMITFNDAQKFTRGVEVNDPNGDVVLIGGQLIPRTRMGEIAESNANWVTTSQPLPPPPPPVPPPSDGGGITISKPLTPALPGSGMQPLLPDATPEARGGSESLCIALGYGNQPDLIGFQQKLRGEFANQPVEWSKPDDLHVTLLYAPTVTDDQASSMITLVRSLHMPDDLALKVGSLNTFDRFNKHSLHFRIVKNVDLLEMQEFIFQRAQWEGIGVSGYSDPARYLPHITMGTLPTKPKPITFDPKLALKPSAIWVYRGDQIVYERALTMPALPQPAQSQAQPTPVPTPSIERSFAADVGVPGASVILSLANCGPLVALLDELRPIMQPEPHSGGIRWTAYADLHLSLLNVPLINDDQLRALAQAITPTALIAEPLLQADGLDVFSQPTQNVLILRVKKTAALMALQQALVSRLFELGVSPGPYDDPDTFQPHVTLAYAAKDIPLELDMARVVNDFAPSAVIVSRDSFLTMTTIPLVPAQRSVMEPPEPLDIVIGFTNAQAVRNAQRELDAFLRERELPNPQWTSEQEWALPLAALEDWEPSEAARLIRNADFTDARKIDLWTNGYALSGTSVYLRVEDSEPLDTLQTSVALEVQGVGRTPLLPAWKGIVLCTLDQPIDLAGAPEAHYPLVANNVTIRRGHAGSVQKQWALRRSPPESRRELQRWDAATRNRGVDYDFSTTYLRDTEVERFVRTALQAEVEREDVFELAYALLDGGWSFRSFAQTKAGFVEAITSLFEEGQSNDISRKKFAAGLRAYLNEYGLPAFRDGMNEVGYNPESFSPAQVAVFRAWRDRQSTYVTGLGAELYGQGISEAEVANRIRMWADVSLGEIHLRGIAEGEGDQLYVWRYRPSAQHCTQCPRLNGQVHTMREWLAEELYPGCAKTDCGPGCQCGFEKAEGSARGNFLRSAPDDAPDDAHDHSHDEPQSEAGEDNRGAE